MHIQKVTKLEEPELNLPKEDYRLEWGFWEASGLYQAKIDSSNPLSPLSHGQTLSEILKVIWIC